MQFISRAPNGISHALVCSAVGSKVSNFKLVRSAHAGRSSARSYFSFRLPTVDNAGPANRRIATILLTDLVNIISTESYSMERRIKEQPCLWCQQQTMLDAR
jgi:hypothetical protein